MTKNNQSNERVLDLVSVLGTDRERLQLHLKYEREERGVTIQVLPAGEGRPAIARSMLLDALGALLDEQLLGVDYLELEHFAEIVRDNHPLGVRKVVERVFPEKDDWPRFSLTVQTDAGQFESGRGDFSMSSFVSLRQDFALTLKVCGDCKLARLMGSGGDDDRHGLFCTRDLTSDEREALARPQPGLFPWRQAMCNVDAFHTCSSFEPAEYPALRTK